MAKSLAHLVVPALLGLSLVACDMPGTGESGSDASEQVVTLTAIENFDMPTLIDSAVLVPSNSPFRGRVVVGLADNSLHLLSLALGELTTVDGVSGKGLAQSANFQLRGVATPLIISSDPETGQILPFLLLAEEDQLVQVPSDIVTAPAIDALCTLRDTQALVEIAAIGDEGISLFQLRDTGDDLLSIRALTSARLSDEARICVEDALGNAVDVSEAGFIATDRKGAVSASLGGATISAAAQVEIEGEQYTLAALPLRQRIVAQSSRPNTKDAFFTVQAGLNAPALTAPDIILASPRNFGGSYNQGVAVLAQGNQLSVLSLDAVTDTITAIDPLTEGVWAQREAERSN
jgi:hypothetical protein